jgi:uncharacterized protein YjbJ (UPF0337 family)
MRGVSPHFVTGSKRAGAQTGSRARATIAWLIGHPQTWRKQLPSHRKFFCPRQSINLKETKMNWDRIEGNWKQFKGNAKEQWGKLTDDQLKVIAGKRDNLAGSIQEAYGISRDEAEKQLADWQQRMKELRSEAQSART